MAYLVTSLVLLRKEIDNRWPNRDRRTDGWLAWPSQRISYGHNPDGKGAVHAIDVDKDGISPSWIINNIRSGGGILWYIIWNRTIWSNTRGFRPIAYTGRNPHTDHMHIEVYRTATAENYRGTWNIWPGATSAVGQAPPSETQWGAADPRAGMTVTGGLLGEAGWSTDTYAKRIRALRT